MSDSLWMFAAAQLTDGYRRGDFTPQQALDACIQRADACQPSINAMVCIDRSAALQATAERSRLRWARGEALGPLDGVPVSVKDNLHVAGLPTTWGSRLLDGHVAPRDQAPVAALRAAGALLFGKTNLPEFAIQGRTANRVCGTTRNPWNTALTPGGSSGGAAAAVAAGCGPLAVATDGAGSIRRPASHGGLVGFMPSAGWVSRDGGLPDLHAGHEVVGGIGRHVDDVAQLVGVLAGLPTGAPAARWAAPVAVRILYVPRFAAHPVDRGIAAAVAQAARHFEAMGHAVDEAPAFELAEAVNAQWPALSAMRLASLLATAHRWPEFGLAPGQAVDLSACSDETRAALCRGRDLPADTDARLTDSVRALKATLATVFRRHDVLLTPATAALPWPVEQSHPMSIDGRPVGPRGHAVFTAFANAAGLPAVALPCGWIDGLPTGFQLVGRPGADAALLALARHYEQAHPWAGHWPALPDGAPGATI